VDSLFLGSQSRMSVVQHIFQFVITLFLAIIRKMLSWEYRNPFFTWGLPVLWKSVLNKGGKVMYVPKEGNFLTIHNMLLNISQGKPHITNPFYPRPISDSARYILKTFPTNNIRFVCISDLHGQQEDIEVPPGDVLLGNKFTWYIFD
jgi:hypothetical protein